MTRHAEAFASSCSRVHSSFSRNCGVTSFPGSRFPVPGSGSIPVPGSWLPILSAWLKAYAPGFLPQTNKRALECRLQGEPHVPPELMAAQLCGVNLLITPHAAFYSDEAFVEMRHLAAKEVGRILRGETPHYQVG